ncbi:hypothetical protein SapgrDRAFT_0453 [Saprospira grandis DSM 2844]|uniref:Uncharacterized protein n=1 Tax=Saprospira grandis DSM 2844 TaxID=694433 RepID=J1I1R6_9BACT|nr:hypothetical protein [Saprospira grandis]EJF52198.1 hypothetical protein SapgrDRAFT_0453 [Saprospira grandis DSM 2844]
MSTQKIAERLAQLGASDCSTNLAEAKIYWTNKEGQVLAHARTAPIMSWAATNKSAAWAFSLGQFIDAEVECFQPQNNKSEYIGNIPEELAQEMAFAEAQGADVPHFYAAANGANMLYLAIYDYKEESLVLTAADWQRKRRSSIGYNLQMLMNMVEILEIRNRYKEAYGLLWQFTQSLDNQLQQKHIKEELVLLEEVQKLRTSVDRWLEILPPEVEEEQKHSFFSMARWKVPDRTAREEVGAFMKQAASKWGRLLKQY